MAKRKLWRYTTGIKGVSRVTVYERRTGASLYVEWWDDEGRHQRSLKTVTGHPITDKDLAREIADSMATAQERKRNRLAAESWYGFSPNRTVGELLSALHADRGPEWSDAYTKDQDRFRDFWTERLGSGKKLTTVTPALVERIAKMTAREREWSDRTHQSYLRYIVDAFSYGQKKLKWLTEGQNLSAVDVPSPNSSAKSYSLTEVRKLLPALERVDPVAGWIGHVLWQTGRRLTAARTLEKANVTVHDKHTVVEWPEETDKAGKEGLSVVVGRAHALAQQLVERPGKYMAGRRPPSLDECQKWIAEAEDAAGVEHVKKRAWHGIKRRFSTATKGMKGRDKQSGTREETLRKHYEVDDDLEAKAEVAETLARQVEE